MGSTPEHERDKSAKPTSYDGLPFHGSSVWRNTRSVRPPERGQPYPPAAPRRQTGRRSRESPRCQPSISDRATNRRSSYQSAIELPIGDRATNRRPGYQSATGLPCQSPDAAAAAMPRQIRSKLSIGPAAVERRHDALGDRQEVMTPEPRYRRHADGVAKPEQSLIQRHIDDVRIGYALQPGALAGRQ